MSEAIKGLDGRRLYQQVADQIRALIRAGQFPPGSRLPAERELAVQLGVSRPSLREALIALEIDGSVEIRMGSGVYVCAPGEEAYAPTRPLGESPSELMRARAAIESTVAQLAAARMTPDTLAQLRQALNAMGAEIDAGRKPLEQDRLFHLTIAAQTGNAVLTRIVRELFDDRHSPISAQMRVRFETPETWRVALAEHEAILEALGSGDPILAQAAMRMHLEASRERWTRD
ncbi:FadR/GntR family transcriptional regulator [Aureimonas sp. AU40]|uniref:FadR/GntR family transcriptional regulator n=1 Tax=Aureimonas sp. AU40 TaxID=1637747 RepID=UPI000783BEF4|nr:FadR/GntR family transcriptional regulator [Aureimonas sp. AU40]